MTDHGAIAANGVDKRTFRRLQRKAVLPNVIVIFERLFAMVIGLVFAYSAVLHLGNPYRFYADVLAYRVVGAGVAEGIVIALPWFQLVTAGILVFGCLRATAYAAAFIAFAAFSTAQFSVLWRGMSISCGCFGSYSHPVTAATASGLLLAAAATASIAVWHIRVARRAESTGNR